MTKGLRDEQNRFAKVLKVKRKDGRKEGVMKNWSSKEKATFDGNYLPNPGIRQNFIRI